MSVSVVSYPGRDPRLFGKRSLGSGVPCLAFASLPGKQEGRKTNHRGERTKATNKNKSSILREKRATDERIRLLDTINTLDKTLQFQADLSRSASRFFPLISLFYDALFCLLPASRVWPCFNGSHRVVTHSHCRVRAPSSTVEESFCSPNLDGSLHACN